MISHRAPDSLSTWRAAILIAVIALLVSCGKPPPKEISTLDKIRTTGVITLGIRETSVPFSYLDDAQQQAGYAWEIANRVATAVKRDLKLDTLAIHTFVVTPQTRIPLVANQTVDLECSSTTHDRERERQVGFSSSFYLTGPRMLVRRDSPVRDWSDLRGKRAVVSSGTTAELALRKLDRERGLDIEIMLAKDIGENFMTVETGRAAASVQDDVILYSNIARARDPSAWQVVGAPLMREAYACMLRKGDVPFKRLVDATIAEMARSGELMQLYTKYFASSLAVKGGVRIDQPLSDDMRELLRQPNDRID
ncbi:MAG: transporter substrate-binding domain-containing protein [Rudaea sp.]|nr:MULTISPECIES: transporter substrate-binding domain-containing protein [unclassified Rudaea]MBN8888489.1 transporter substrate-binding domain-containing protein [Rudaea sp.]MBR0345258.1 transporter substrate-binding domain-containing protein [Rudaea sp.]